MIDEIKKNKITAISSLNEVNLKEIIDVSNIKLPRFFNVKKALKNNYNHEYVKMLNLDINKKMKDLNLKERYLLEFLLKVFNEEIIVLELFINKELKEKIFDIIKKSNKTCVLLLNDLEDLKVADYVYLFKDNKLIEYKEINSEYVKIIGESINKALFPLKNMKIDHFNKDEIEFIYNGNINDLTPYLTKIKIESLEIRDLKLDEIYKYYYKKWYNKKVWKEK